MMERGGLFVVLYFKLIFFLFFMLIVVFGFVMIFGGIDDELKGIEY